MYFQIYAGFQKNLFPCVVHIGLFERYTFDHNFSSWCAGGVGSNGFLIKTLLTHHQAPPLWIKHEHLPHEGSQWIARALHNSSSSPQFYSSIPLVYIYVFCHWIFALVTTWLGLFKSAQSEMEWQVVSSTALKKCLSHPSQLHRKCASSELRWKSPTNATGATSHLIQLAIWRITCTYTLCEGVWLVGVNSIGRVRPSHHYSGRVGAGRWDEDTRHALIPPSLSPFSSFSPSSSPSSSSSSSSSFCSSFTPLNTCKSALSPTQSLPLILIALSGSKAKLTCPPAQDLMIIWPA